MGTTTKRSTPYPTIDPELLNRQAPTRRQRRTAPAGTVDFSAYRRALGEARRNLGIDETDPVFNRTDLDVLTEVAQILRPDANGAYLLDYAEKARTLVSGLIRRKAAKKIAAQQVSGQVSQ